MNQAVSPKRPSTKGANGVGTAKPEGKAPFFLINAQRLGEIAQHQVQEKFKPVWLGPHEMQAYIAQWAGVNGNLAALGRISTHGPDAVADRALLSSSSAKNALDNLVQAGFLTRCTGIQHPSLPPLIDTTFKVDPNHPPDLALAQAFLAGKKTDKRQKHGTLRSLAHNAKHGPGVSKPLAVMDAIQVFVSLHAVQDFDRYAGVDPTLIGASCQRLPWSPGMSRQSRDLILSEVQPIVVQVPKHVAVHPGFVQQVMGYLPSDALMAKEDERFNRALRNLQACGLIYDAYVLWDNDPTHSSSRIQPSVIATLEVFEPQDRRMEDELVPEMKKLADALCPWLDMGYLGHSVKACDPDPGHFRILVEKHLGPTACVVRQLRVRHWAHNANNLGALAVDAARIQHEVSTFVKIKKSLRARL